MSWPIFLRLNIEAKRRRSTNRPCIFQAENGRTGNLGGSLLLWFLCQFLFRKSFPVPPEKRGMSGHTQQETQPEMSEFVSLGLDPFGMAGESGTCSESHILGDSDVTRNFQQNVVMKEDWMKIHVRCFQYRPTT